MKKLEEKLMKSYERNPNDVFESEFYKNLRYKDNDIDIRVADHPEIVNLIISVQGYSLQLHVENLKKLKEKIKKERSTKK